MYGNHLDSNFAVQPHNTIRVLWCDTTNIVYHQNICAFAFDNDQSFRQIIVGDGGGCYILCSRSNVPCAHSFPSMPRCHSKMKCARNSISPPECQEFQFIFIFISINIESIYLNSARPISELQSSHTVLCARAVYVYGLFHFYFACLVEDASLENFNYVNVLRLEITIYLWLT